MSCTREAAIEAKMLVVMGGLALTAFRSFQERSIVIMGASELLEELPLVRV